MIIFVFLVGGCGEILAPGVWLIVGVRGCESKLRFAPFATFRGQTADWRKRGGGAEGDDGGNCPRLLFGVWFFFCDRLRSEKLDWSRGLFGLERFCGVRGIVDLDGAAGKGDVDRGGVEQIGGAAAVADDLVGFREWLEPLAVGGGESQAVEERVCALGVDEVAGESVDDLGEGELDGEAILERRETDDVAALHEALTADHSGAIEVVALVEAAVEVTEERIGEGDGAAWQAVGLDVAAEVDLHVILLGTRFGGDPG
jgi:hypothetical protein